MTQAPKLKLEIASKLLKRFSAGALVGLTIGAIQWSAYSYFFGEPLPLIRAIAFCLLISVSCGLLTLKWGYEIIENLLQLLG